MKLSNPLRWALWAGLCGVGQAAVFVALLSYIQGSLICRILWAANRLGIFIANWATGVVFPGDRIRYPIVTMPEFFDIVLVLAAGLQTALLGAVIGFILSLRKSQAN
jgi:hypothetical protein